MRYTSGYARLATQAVPRISTTQLVLGVITIIFGIPIIVESHGESLGQYYSANGFVATAIWAGVYFIINGAFGLKAALSDTAANILTTLVLNSISLLFSGSLVGLSAYSAFATNKHCPFSDYYLPPQESKNYLYSASLNDRCVNRNALLALDTFLMLLGLCQFILAVVSIKFNKEALVISEVRATDNEIRRDFVWFSYRQKKSICVLGDRTGSYVTGLHSIWHRSGSICSWQILPIRSSTRLQFKRVYGSWIMVRCHIFCQLHIPPRSDVCQY